MEKIPVQHPLLLPVAPVLSPIYGVIANPEARVRWCGQLADILNPYITKQSTVLEVGCGEATTLAGVLKRLNSSPKHALGFDISWSRCAHGLSVGEPGLAQKERGAVLS